MTWLRMIFSLLVSFLFVALAGRGFAADRLDLFVGGEDGYDTYRIPALIVTSSGTVLAFCEGRKNGPEDTGDIDLLQKRSEDGGVTWSETPVIVFERGDDAPLTVGNPVPILDRDNGRVHLLFTQDYQRVFRMFSDDDGQSWSPAAEITDAFDGFDYPQVLVATGPGHGIQTRAGTLVAPIWMSDRPRGERYLDNMKSRIRAGVIFSEDGGRSWKAGGLVPATVNRLHEATVAERSDGTLVMNIRNRGSGYRAVATSDDEGSTWTEPRLDERLPCPTCHASLLAASETPNKRWYFLNPAVEGQETHSSRRRRLTLRTSTDEGRTWPWQTVIRPGRAGYSDLAITPGGRLLCLYENGSETYREKISLEIFTADELEAMTRDQAAAGSP